MRLKSFLLGCLSTLLLGTGIGYGQNNPKLDSEIKSPVLKDKKLYHFHVHTKTDKTVTPNQKLTYILDLPFFVRDKISGFKETEMDTLARLEFIKEARNYTSNDSLRFDNYDPALRVMIPYSNKDFNLGPVLNDRFAPYLKNINDCIAHSEYPSKHLKEECKKHVKTFNQEADADTVIMFTHPLYLHLSDWADVWRENIRKEADQYLERFVNLLRTIPRDRFDVMLFEGKSHYAAATNLLLETGLIDKVYFTEEHSGSLPESTDISELKGKVFFVAGGYNRRCLRGTNKALLKITDYEKLIAIKEMCINHPNSYETLLPDNISSGYSNPALQAISYKDFLKVIN